MKNIAIMLLMTLFLAACNKAIDLHPISSISSNDFYKTDNDFINATNSAYGRLQSLYGNDMWVITELVSDNTYLTAAQGGNQQSNADIDNLKTTSTNTVIADFWLVSYRGIADCNVVMDRSNNITFQNPALKTRLIGEVSFLRALYYFNLVQIFGDIPITLHEITNPASPDVDQTRKPVDQVYQVIINDLKNAVNNLPGSYSGSDLGRATKYAAESLLGKVYLTRKDYANALPVLTDVVNNGGYQLLSNYADVFLPANKNSKEMIFAVQYDGSIAGEGSPFVNLFAPTNSTTVAPSGSGTGANQPTPNIISAYEAGDKRLNGSLNTSYINAKGVVVAAAYINKFLNGTTTASYGNDNWPVLRYADVLLMLSEVQFNINGGGLPYLNMVRTRAGLAAKASIDALTIEKERRVELAFEDHRWFDLLRTGRALAVMNAYLPTGPTTALKSISAFQLLFPIPQAQIDVSGKKLTQNPGY